MSRVAVVSAGASALRLWSDAKARDYDCVIAVNRAALAFDCDWLAFLDKEMREALERGEIRPRLGAMTHPQMRLPESVTRRELWLYNKRAEDLPASGGQMGIRQCNFTFPCALWEAGAIADGGPVHVYGMDCNALPDAGQSTAGDRTMHRWSRELSWVKQVWRPHWESFGEAPAEVLAYLRGEVGWPVAEKALRHAQAGILTAPN